MKDSLNGNKGGSRGRLRGCVTKVLFLKESINKNEIFETF